VLRGNRLIPGVKVGRAALRGRLDPVDGILENAGARTAFEARKRLLFWVGKALTSVTEDKIMERRVTVAEVLKRQRMMGSREGRLKSLAEWLESRFGSAAGRETPGAAMPARVAELLAKPAISRVSGGRSAACDSRDRRYRQARPIGFRGPVAVCRRPFLAGMPDVQQTSRRGMLECFAVRIPISESRVT